MNPAIQDYLEELREYLLLEAQILETAGSKQDADDLREFAASLSSDEEPKGGRIGFEQNRALRG